MVKMKINNKYIAQGLVEYILVFIFAAVVIYAFVAKIDLKKIKNFAVYGIRNQNEQGKIIIPPMAD